MNKNIYLLGIFFLLMTAASGLMQSLILFKQGFSIIYLQTYVHWYLIFGLVYFAGSAFVLYYFYIKQMRFVFVAALVATLVSALQFVVQYSILLTVAREFALVVSVLAIVVCLCNTVLAAGLFFSPARRDKVLISLGVFMMFHCVALFISVSGKAGLSQEQTMNAMIWLAATTNVFPIFYIIVFLREIFKTSPVLRISTIQETLYYGIGSAGMIAAVTLLILGGKLSTESFWYRDWQNRAQEEARKLAERFETRIFVGSEGDTLYYLFLKPLDYDSVQKYPMVTCLHGGPTRDGGHVEVTQPAPLLSEPTNRKKYPAFLFVPQAGPGVLWGGMGEIPSKEKLVFEAMHALEQEFSIDDKRRYVAGISGGGYGSWHFISTHPDMFAAAIPICGAGNPDYAEEIAHVPVWAFHGDADRNVPVSGSRDMIEAMRKAGGNPKYSEFAGVGHNVWPEVSNTEGVMDWLFAQRK